MVVDINEHKKAHSCPNCMYNDARYHACYHPNYAEILMKYKSRCAGFTEKNKLSDTITIEGGYQMNEKE